MTRAREAALEAYRAAGHTRSGVAQVMALYDQVVDHLTDVRENWETSTFDGAFAAIQRAAATVGMLSASLDDRRGGRVSEILRRYYRALSVQILSIPRQPDPLARIDSLFRQIKIVREAWGHVHAQHPAARDDTKGTVHGTVSTDPA